MLHRSSQCRRHGRELTSSPGGSQPTRPPPPRLRGVARTVTTILGLESRLPTGLLDSGPDRIAHRREAARRSAEANRPYRDVLDSIAALRWARFHGHGKRAGCGPGPCATGGNHNLWVLTGCAQLCQARILAKLTLCLCVFHSPDVALQCRLQAMGAPMHGKVPGAGGPRGAHRINHEAAAQRRARVQRRRCGGRKRKDVSDAAAQHTGRQHGCRISASSSARHTDACDAGS